MKKLILTVFTTAFCLITQAQSDAKATEILNKVAKIYKSYTTMTATFSLTTKPASGKAVTSTGTVWLKGTSKFKLDYGGQIIYCNGTYIWTWDKDDNGEVTKEKFKINDASIQPNEIFTIYNKDFKNAYEGPTTRNGKTYEVIKMVPKKTTAQYSYIKLEIDKSTNKISRAITHYKNGTDVTIEIKTFTPNTAMADTTFEWDTKAHPKVSVVDLTTAKKSKSVNVR